MSDFLEIGADIKRMQAENERRSRLIEQLRIQNQQLVHLRSCMEKGYSGININFSGGEGSWSFAGNSLKSDDHYTKLLVKMHELAVDMAVVAMEKTYAALQETKDA